MGARKKPEGAKMSVQVGVAITKQKKEEYMATAENVGLTYSDWVRKALDERQEKDKK